MTFEEWAARQDFISGQGTSEQWAYRAWKALEASTTRTAAELRAAAKTLRRSPIPLKDLIPLLTKAADELDRT